MHARAVLLEYYCKLTALLSVCVMVVSVFVYVTFLLLAVGRTEVRAQAEANSKEISSELGSVQGQYIAATQSVTPERAAALGFVQPRPADVVYIDTASRTFVNNVKQ